MTESCVSIRTIRQCKLMNAIHFYNIVRRLYGFEDVVMGSFVNPLLNRHDAFEDAQFVDHNGNPIPPWHRYAADFFLADPLEGPFYRLPLIGWWGKRQRNKPLRPMFFTGVVVTLPNGENVGSSPIGIISEAKDVLCRIQVECGDLPRF